MEKYLFRRLMTIPLSDSSSWRSFSPTQPDLPPSQLGNKFLAQETSTGSLALRAQVQPDIVCPQEECVKLENDTFILSNPRNFHKFPRSPKNHNKAKQSQPTPTILSKTPTPPLLPSPFPFIPSFLNHLSLMSLTLTHPWLTSLPS